MQAVARDVWVETNFHGCSLGFVVTSQGVVMIDSPMLPSDALRWKTEVEKRGEPRYLINTEHHMDHILGNFFFPVTVISHQGTREKFLSSLGKLEEMRGYIEQMDPEGAKLLKEYQPRMPSITFLNRLDLHLGQYRFKLLHLPGHVQNGVVVHIPQARVLFTGDNVSHGFYPWLHECVPLQWLKTLKEIKGMDVDVIVPGHGNVCTKEALTPLFDYLETLFGEVQQVIDKGFSRQEAIAKASFPPPLPIQPGLEERFREIHRTGVGRIYDELVKGHGAEGLA